MFTNKFRKAKEIVPYFTSNGLKLRTLAYITLKLCFDSSNVLGDFAAEKKQHFDMGGTS